MILAYYSNTVTQHLNLSSIITHGIHYLEFKNTINHNGTQIISKKELYRTCERLHSLFLTEFINSEKLTL